MDISNIPQKALDILVDPGTWGTTLTIAITVTTIVGIISIILEVMTIIFLLTPSEKDDAWLGKVKKVWYRIKPILDLLHIKTPIIFTVNKVHAKVQVVRETVEQYKVKKAEKLAKAMRRKIEESKGQNSDT